jgi:hypothetical protein
MWQHIARWVNGRQRMIPVVVFSLLLLPVVTSHAFWPFGGGNGGSGLDLNKGYDVNTVTTVKGKVLSINPDKGGGPVLIEIKSSTGGLFLVAGPRWFWDENGIPVMVGDELSARGSISEGKDGRRYLLAQKLENQRTGEEIILRGDDGIPVWMKLKQSAGQSRPAEISPGPKASGRIGSGPRGRR